MFFEGQSDGNRSVSYTHLDVYKRQELASNEAIDILIDIILNKRGYALDTAVSIVIELIRKNNSDYDQVNLLETTIIDNPPIDRDPIYLGYLLKKFSINLPNFLKIIVDIETDDSIPLRENQLHEKFKPLGFERFKIVELIAELLHCSNMGLMNSRKAEKIALKRDKYRKRANSYDVHHTLSNLSIRDKNSITTLTGSDSNDLKSNNDNSNDFNENDDTKAVKKPKTNNDPNINTSINASEEQEEVNEESDSSIEEIDESFEIPYINESQNMKLREYPTMGDLFKISLYDTQVMPQIMKLFLAHPWNNFWHNVIFDIIQQIFNGRMDFSYNSFLVYSLFNLKGSLQYMPPDVIAGIENIEDVNFAITTDFILKGYHDSFKFYETRKTNLGYMGHLVLVAEEIIKFSRLYKVELISPDIQEATVDKDWRYYSNDVLNETRIMYSKILGGGTYVDDGNGNIVPQLATDGTPEENMGIPSSDDQEFNTNFQEMKDGGELINVEALEEQLMLSTESDLHNKLREMLASQGQKQVDDRNAKNGVIILGPPPQEEEENNVDEDDDNHYAYDYDEPKGANEEYGCLLYTSRCV